MTSLTNVSRLTYLAVALAAGVAMLSGVNGANASSRHHDNDVENTGMNSHTHQSASEKKAQHEKKKKDKTVIRKKQCLYITSDGKRCGGTASANPPTNGSAGSNPPANGSGSSKSSSGNTVTISNGSTKVDIPNGPGGLIISSNSPGTITVFNGTTSQTLRGGSITLSGAGVASGSVFTQTTPGLQTRKLTNGDVSIAVNPPPPGQAKPAGKTPTEDGSLGAELKGAAKDLGNEIEHLGDYLSWGSATPAHPKTSTTTQE
jgi:hypothetical protein